jgi:hypothetical protein
MSIKQIISEIRKLSLEDKLELKYEIEILISKEIKKKPYNDFLIDYEGEKKGKKKKRSYPEEIDVIL